MLSNPSNSLQVSLMKNNEVLSVVSICTENDMTIYDTKHWTESILYILIKGRKELLKICLNSSRKEILKHLRLNMNKEFIHQGINLLNNEKVVKMQILPFPSYILILTH